MQHLFSGDGHGVMTREQFFELHKQMGTVPDEADIPIDFEDLGFEAKQAVILFNILPDKIEGMGGVWMGKEYSGLSDIMNIYSMNNPKTTMNLLLVCISEASKHYERQRKSSNRELEIVGKKR